MYIPLKCPKCKKNSWYDIEKISGKTIIYRDVDFRMPANFPETVVVQCQHCTTEFKVIKQAIEQAIIDANVLGETRGG